MGQQVVAGAMIKCTMGTAPCSLNVLPSSLVTAGGKPAAHIMDNAPLVNILPFGQCMSIANPMVASATAAALGVLTPMPCLPATPAPWSPGSPTVQIGNFPALQNTSMAQCVYGGTISVLNAGQPTVMVP